MRRFSGTILLTALLGCNCSGESNKLEPPDSGDAGAADVTVADSGENNDFEDASVADVPDVGTSTAPRWLGFEGWETVPGTSPDDRCKVRQAVVGDAPPPFDFEPCGAGCLRASLVFPPAEWLGDPALSVDAVSGHMLLRGIAIDVTPDEPGRPNVGAIFDLSANRLLGGTITLPPALDVSCLPGPFRGNVRSFGIEDLERPGPYPKQILLGTLAPSGWAWRPPWFLGGVDGPIGLCQPFTDGGDPPHLLFGCGRTLKVMRQAGSSELEEPFPSRVGGIVAGAGSGGTAVMVELLPEVRFQLHTYDREHGLRTFGDPAPGWPCEVAIGDRFVALITGDVIERTAACDTYVANPAIQIFDRTTGQRTSVGAGPGPDATTSLIQTFGDYVVAFIDSEEGGVMILLRVSDGQIRRIEPHDGYAFHSESIGVDNDSLWFVERIAGANQRYYGRWVYKYDLSRFEELGPPYPP